MRLSSSRILMINRFYFWNISFWTHDNFISCKYCRSTFAEMEARRTICYVLLEIARIPFSLLRDNCVKISFARMDSYVPVRGLLHCENKLFAESAVRHSQNLLPSSDGPCDWISRMRQAFWLVVRHHKLRYDRVCRGF